MKKIKKPLFFAFAIIYIIVSPIIVKLFLDALPLSRFFTEALTIILLAFVFFNTLTVIKLMIDFDKYGSPFKKIKKYTYNELIISEINNLNTYQKYLNISNNLLVINESGIFEFATLNKKGILKGDINDVEWTINDKKIKNPFIVKENIYHYFIIQPEIIFKVTGVWLTTRKFIYNTLEKRLNEKKYTRDEIEKIYNDLKVKYGNYKD